jgi:hypothetical protein
MKRIRPIVSIMLALLTLFSASSVTVGIHFCQGKVKNLAFFSKAESCEREQKLPPCHRHKAAPCCEDETIVHEGQSFQSLSSDITIAAAPVTDILQTPVLLAEIIPASVQAQTRYYNYDPPLRSEDRIVTHRIFLI